MSTARDAFLQRVRQAVAEGNRAGAAAAVEARGNVGYQGGGPDAVARFCTELAGAGGHAHLVADHHAAAEKVLELIAASGGRRILLGQGDVLDALGLADRLHGLGMEVTRMADLPREGAKELMFAADVGISGVWALIAETGSIVARTEPAEPRSLSLLPPTHIAVASREQLLADLFDLFAALERGDAEPPVMPSCLTLITGPSKTGDIELRLVTGVHGPGEVHVVLIIGER
jgi:L-lactate utilization protein LutC